MSRQERCNKERVSPETNLCRYLCRNPAMPTSIVTVYEVSLGHTLNTASAIKISMNIVVLYHLRLLGLVLCRWEG